MPFTFAAASNTPGPKVVPYVSVGDGLHTTVGVACTTVPDKPTVCGLPVALSAIARVASRVPVAFGEKATVTRQLLSGGSVAVLQPSLDIAKSPALEPEMLAEILDRGAFPLFVSVAVATGPPEEVNESITGATDAVGLAPFPVIEMDCIFAGLP